MTKRTIIFRADGSSTIGMGHFIRTLALAEMLNEHFFCVFATRNPTEYQIAEIEKVCNDRIELPEDDSHFDVFLECLKGDEIVVLDNYFFTTEYQKDIKVKGCKLVCIDDMHDKHYVADIVINHAPGITVDKFMAQPYTKCLLGTRYVILRPDFLAESHSIETLKPIKKRRVLICFGGSDFNNLTMEMLLLISDYNCEITVITGEAYPFEDKLHDFMKTFQGEIFHKKNIDACEMRKAFMNNDLAIVPASGILFEAISVGIPIISGFYIQNQYDIYHGFLDLGVIYGAGDFSRDSFLNAWNSVESKMSIQMIKNQKDCIDGKSPIRIRKAFENI